MKKFTLVSVVIAVFLMTGIANAQNIAISDVSHTADASAVLDVYSTSLGMLVPRMASAPSSPANGLFYYNTGSNSFYYNAGTSGSPSWTELSFGNLWSRAGTTDTYLSNATDNLLIGTSTTGLGYKFYVYGAGAQTSRFDGVVDFFNNSTGTLDAQVSDDGSGNGVFSVQGSGQVKLRASGASFFAGGDVCIGATNPLHLLHLIDPTGVAAPQLQVDNATGAGNSSLGFGNAGTSFSQGIYGATGDYEICNTSGLVASAQSDGATMMRSFPNGIVDFNNQSRARAFQQQNPNIIPPNPNYGQIIPYDTWTMVNFDNPSYDEQNEWTMAMNAATGPSYFKAKEEGYYQVNSRIDFVLDDVIEGQEGVPIHSPMYPGYVSIAIFVSSDGQNWSMYAQGNKLQGHNGGSGWTDLRNNLAPNVSDVVQSIGGFRFIAIFAYQNLWTNGIPLRTMGQPDINGVAGGPPTQVYCSIHKSS